MIAKKIKKLIRDPKLFFADMWLKHSSKINKIKPKKFNGNNHFTVISAVYGVEKYLDDYLKSLISQQLDFLEHIQLILVDDGSTDNSASIIKKWRDKYPNNILYIYKENGGQASARNLGIKYAQTEWITFIDPDDFVSLDYFYEVDKLITKNQSAVLASCNFIYYFENQKMYKNTHPLKYRFAKGDDVVPINNLKNYIQLSAASGFFKLSEIKKHHIEYDERVKPNFEDAKFVSNYLTRVGSGDVIFASQPKYFYRKREDGTSTLDNSWKNEKLFSSVLEFGCLAILVESKKKYGFIPVHTQRTVLYHLIWYFKELVNNKHKIGFLSEYQKSHFETLVQEIFRYIDSKTILDFNLAGTWFLHRVALLGKYKEETIPFQLSYIEKYDDKKNQVLMRFYTFFDSSVEFTIDGELVLPSYSKVLEHTFLDGRFACENIMWIPLGTSNDGQLQVTINGLVSKLSMGGKHYKNSIEVGVIKNYFKSRQVFNSLEEDIWLIMDRDTQADDNAEHFYRYMQKNHPEQRCYFALSSNSHDWMRLKSEEFNLLEFGSNEFELIIKKSKKIISSHMDRYITNYFDDDTLIDKDFIFLQHGVTQLDISDWVNSKKGLSLFTASSKGEYHSLISNYGQYALTNKEVVLTGFSRHDQLLSNNKHDGQIILIMPTWRKWIVGKVIDGNEREKNNQFTSTEYSKHWTSFLISTELKELAEKYDYKIVFAPHANIEPYLEDMGLPEYISIWKAKDGSIQNLFQYSTLMITDYSSVAFEMAYLQKMVLYYHFDYDKFIDGGHIGKSSYFSYDLDGFGPVSTTEDDLLAALTKVLKNGGYPYSPYDYRIKNTFPFRDGKNSERIFEALKKMDVSESKIDQYFLDQQIQAAYVNHRWELMEEYSHKLLSIGAEEQNNRALEALAIAYDYQNKFEKCELLLDSKNIQFDLSRRLRARLYFVQENWDGAAAELAEIVYLNKSDYFLLAKCYANMQDVSKLWGVYKNYDTDNLDQNEKIFYEVLICIAKQEWSSAIKMLNSCLFKFTKKDYLKYSIYRPQLMLAKSYREIGNYVLCNKSLADYEKHTLNDRECRLEIFRLAVQQNRAKKAISQVAQIFGEYYEYMPIKLAEEYAKNLFELKKYKNFDSLSSYYEKKGILIKGLIPLCIFRKFQYKDWIGIISLAKELESSLLRENWYFIAVAHKEAGDFSRAYRFSIAIDYHTELITDEKLSFLGDLMILNRDWVRATDIYKKLVNGHCEDVRRAAWERLLHVQIMQEFEHRQVG